MFQQAIDAASIAAEKKAASLETSLPHSIANMTLLALALFQPHAETLSWLGYVANLVPVTLGNIVGGAVFVAGAYWLASPLTRRKHATAEQPAQAPAGAMAASSMTSS